MQARNEILDWAKEGRSAPRDLRRALEVADVIPDAAACEFRVAPDGECLLTGMRGEKLERLGPPAKQ